MLELVQKTKSDIIRHCAIRYRSVLSDGQIDGQTDRQTELQYPIPRFVTAARGKLV